MKDTLPGFLSHYLPSRNRFLAALFGSLTQADTKKPLRGERRSGVISLVVLSNVVYQVCAKSVPKSIHPLASLTVTYLVGAVASGALYYALNRGGNLLREYGKLNWAPFVLGIVIVGLEAGWIYAYKAGWQVSVGFIVQSAFLAVTLILVGYFLYHEALTWNKLAGAVICLIGLMVINLK